MSSARLAVLLGALASAWGAETCLSGDDPSLLQLRGEPAERPLEASDGEAAKQGRGKSRWPADRYDLAGKSVYLVMTDRFNNVDPHNTTENPNCVAEENWCGGTLKGITEKIPYIQGMGFDAIWVTPVVKQSPLRDAPPPNSEQAKGGCAGSGYSYHGYWAEDYYEIDPSYGTSQDLKDLVEAVHDAGMVFVLDIVTNHMRPIHPDPGWEVETIVPFNDPKYYHQLKPLDRPGGDDWDAYTALYCDWPSPMQAMSPGTLCYLNITDGVPDYNNNGNYCNNYKGNPFGEMVYNNDTFLGKDAPGPPGLKYCGPGNYCEGYNQTRIWDGWFYDLGDLNHSIPFVRETQFEWLRQMRANYSLDGIRLDTAPFMPWTFLKDLQAAAHPMQIIGEVTTSNISWHASFQHDSELGSVVAGLENFPPFYMATPGFCNDTGNLNSPEAMGNLTFLGRTMQEQIKPRHAGGKYTDLGTLMNFMDQQDYPPIASQGTCKHNASLIKNGLAWVMFSYGMPVITWGTEQGNNVYRNTLWTLGFDTTTWQYNFIKTTNAIRKNHNIAKAGTEVVSASTNQLVFVRGGRKSGVWVFTNNLQTNGSVTYRVAPRKPFGWGCKVWYDALSGKKARITKRGWLIAPSSDPVVLVLKSQKGRK